MLDSFGHINKANIRALIIIAHKSARCHLESEPIREIIRAAFFPTGTASALLSRRLLSAGKPPRLEGHLFWPLYFLGELAITADWSTEKQSAPNCVTVSSELCHWIISVSSELFHWIISASSELCHWFISVSSELCHWIISVSSELCHCQLRAVSLDYISQLRAVPLDYISQLRAVSLDYISQLRAVSMDYFSSLCAVYLERRYTSRPFHPMFHPMYVPS